MHALVAGSASPSLAKRLAKSAQAELLRPIVQRFPDGEIYVRLQADLEGKEVAVVQSLSPPQNDHLMELLLLLDLVRDLKAKKILAIVPYLAYARQDRRFQEGEALSVKSVADLLSRRIHKLLTVDAHSQLALSYFSCEIEEVRALPYLGKKMLDLNLRDPLFLAPDEGSAKRVEEAAREAGADFDFLEKERISPTEVRIKPRELKTSGRDVVIMDDIISTGGTVLEACKCIRGARRIWVCCVHGLFVGDSVEKLRKAGVERIVSSDSVETSYSQISLAPLISARL